MFETTRRLQSSLYAALAQLVAGSLPSIRREEGQTLAEYALILALIAVVVVTVVVTLGTTISKLFTSVASHI